MEFTRAVRKLGEMEVGEFWPKWGFEVYIPSSLRNENGSLSSVV